MATQKKKQAEPNPSLTDGTLGRRSERVGRDIAEAVKDLLAIESKTVTFNLHDPIHLERIRQIQKEARDET